MKLKVCLKCGIEKPISEFYFRKDTNKYRNDCKECFSNQTKILKYEKYPWRKHFYSARRRCENPKAFDYKWYGKKDVKCLITLEEIKKLWFRDKAYLMKKPSIDREDNNGNYTFDNCKFIEMDINRIKNRGKAILQFSLEGNFIKKWNSIKEASRIYGEAINDCLRNRTQTSKHFIWRYADV